MVDILVWLTYPPELGTCSFPVDCFLGTPEAWDLSLGTGWKKPHADHEFGCIPTGCGAAEAIGIFYFLEVKIMQRSAGIKGPFSYLVFVGYMFPDLLTLPHPAFRTEFQRTQNKRDPEILVKVFALEIENVPRSWILQILQLHLSDSLATSQFAFVLLIRETFAEGFLWCEALWIEAQIGACQNGSQIEVLGDVPRDLGPHDFCRYTKKLHSFCHTCYICAYKYITTA